MPHAYYSIRNTDVDLGLGFSSKTDSKHYSVVDEAKKLTIEEMNRYSLHIMGSY